MEEEEEEDRWSTEVVKIRYVVVNGAQSTFAMSGCRSFHQTLARDARALVKEGEVLTSRPRPGRWAAHLYES